MLRTPWTYGLGSKVYMLRSLCDKAHRWALALLATHLGIFHNPVCSIPATAAAAATKLNPNPQPLCAAYLQRLQQNKSMHGRNAKGTDAYVFDDELHDLDEVADNVGDSAKLISMASLDLHAQRASRLFVLPSQPYARLRPAPTRTCFSWTVRFRCPPPFLRVSFK